MLSYLCQKQRGGLRLSGAEGVYHRRDGHRQRAAAPPQGWALSEYLAGWALGMIGCQTQNQTLVHFAALGNAS